MSWLFSPRQNPRHLLHAFLYGSLVVLLLCLCVTSFVFSATYLKKERARAEISKDQLSGFFDYQYRPVTEEMWTQNYEAINLRISSIAQQMGHASYKLILTNPSGVCVYSSDRAGANRNCEIPSGLRQQIPEFKPSLPQPVIQFDKAANQYIYMVPLYIGAILKGYLYAAIADPYEFYRGDSIALTFKTFIIPIAFVILIWIAWLLASKQFILRPYLSSLVDLEKKQALGELAAHVAHDIRSPLESLKTLVRNFKGLDEKQHRLFQASSSRIENIANDLITQFTNITRADADSFCFLSAAVDSIVAEKIALLGENSNIDIRSEIPTDLCLTGVPICTTEFSRVLSNILNNSIEAVRDRDRGTITVTASATSGQVSIAIRDNGKGIPQDILHKLRTMGGSYGKSGGSGIGLQHAKTTVSKAGGTISIDSTPEKGTSLTLNLPSADLPRWCASSLDLTDANQIVVLDDDDSVHLLWRQRLGEEGVVYLKDPEQFDILSYPPETTRYVFDHDICGSPVTGLDLIVSHKLGRRAVLVTSYFNEPSIQRAVERAGASILPKFMISKAEIKRVLSNRKQSLPRQDGSYDLVLIDDDTSLHELWTFEAEQLNCRLLTLQSPNEFQSFSIPLTTPIYVDKNLGDGVSGLDIATRLHSQGYTNIFITTGNKVEPEEKPSFVCGVRNKSFPIDAMMVSSA